MRHRLSLLSLLITVAAIAAATRPAHAKRCAASDERKLKGITKSGESLLVGKKYKKAFRTLLNGWDLARVSGCSEKPFAARFYLLLGIAAHQMQKCTQAVIAISIVTRMNPKLRIPKKLRSRTLQLFYRAAKKHSFDLCRARGVGAAKFARLQIALSQAKRIWLSGYHNGPGRLPMNLHRQLKQILMWSGLKPVKGCRSADITVDLLTTAYAVGRTYRVNSYAGHGGREVIRYTGAKVGYLLQMAPKCCRSRLPKSQKVTIAQAKVVYQLKGNLFLRKGKHRTKRSAPFQRTYKEFRADVKRDLLPSLLELLVRTRGTRVLKKAMRSRDRVLRAAAKKMWRKRKK